MAQEPERRGIKVKVLCPHMTALFQLMNQQGLSLYKVVNGAQTGRKLGADLYCANCRKRTDL